MQMHHYKEMPFAPLSQACFHIESGLVTEPDVKKTIVQRQMKSPANPVMNHLINRLQDHSQEDKYNTDKKNGVTIHSVLLLLSKYMNQMFNDMLCIF